MNLTRRAFAASLGGAGVIGVLPFPARLAAATTEAALGPALATITAYARQHLEYYRLPALTLGVAIPASAPFVRHFGYSNVESRTPVTDQSRFQIGSISKLLTAAVIHQLVAEGRFALTDSVAVLVPDLPLPRRDGITVQQLLDHVSGLPGDAPLFPPGGLWTGFKPGSRWYYSNTGYDILGKLVEAKGGQPLARQLHERIFRPLGMVGSKGAITAPDRAFSAQGYEPVDNSAPYVRGAPLAPTSWVDVTFAAGSTLSTASDMILLMRSIAAAAQGRGGLGLAPAAALRFARHAVATDNPVRRYGNGLMHDRVGDRTLLHHTGGMVSFSSAFHLDPASGVGAFASTSLTGLAGYRPRALTLFAIDAVNSALAAKPLPRPPALATPIANAADYLGTYSGPMGSFTITGGDGGLTIAANGGEARLEHSGGDMFATLHPDFRTLRLMFERSGKAVGGASWGGASFVRAGSAWRPAASDSALRKFAGRYSSDSPWWGVIHIHERGGRLWLGTETRLTRIGDNLWRLGDEPWSPERARFADPVGGRPDTLYLSGEKFVRHDV